MPRKAKAKSAAADSAANLGFEAKLWLAADKLRNNMDAAECKNGGQFYTPGCIVRLLVSMLSPYKGRVYDPCCGATGMFVQSEKFVLEYGGRIGDLAIYGQESNATPRRLAIMNVAIRGVEGDLGPEHADTFRRDPHLDRCADYSRN